MRIAFFSASLLLSSLSNAAVPINGWYYGLFGGYSYIPNNINTAERSLAEYKNGYNAGGSIGFQNNPMRYEGQITYLNANLKQFSLNTVPQTGVSGYNNGILALANVYYDFHRNSPTFQPFLGMGIGYAWIHAILDSTGPTGVSTYSGSHSVFAYQASAGLTFNFAENYALYGAYRYIITNKVQSLGKSFQGNLANLGVVYRFDKARYQ